MAEPDFFDSIQAGREAFRRMQESFARYAMPQDQRQAMLDGMSKLMFPTDGVRAMSDLIDAFGPPLAQIETLRAELAEQREQVKQLDDRLAHLEVTADRLATAAEQITAFQEPFIRMANMATGQDFRPKRAARTDDVEESDDADDSTAFDKARESASESNKPNKGKKA